MSAQFRDVTPPPRSRCSAYPEGRAMHQRDWSANPGSNDWTSSPLPRPKDNFEIKDALEKGLLSPKANTSANRDCLQPLKVNEDACFSSPKPAMHDQTPGSFGESVVEGLFTSPVPQVGSCGKENWQPAQGLRGTLTPTRTPMKTPSRLPTVQENDGQMPTLDECETMPAWVMQSPVPTADGQTAEEFDIGMAMKGLGLSPAPPGLEDVRCELPKHQVKGTFIQFVSPLKTFALNSPPKTEPVNFAPSSAAACSRLWDSFCDHQDESGLAVCPSPSPWFTHEQIPFFPHAQQQAMPAAPPPPLGCVDLDQAIPSCPEPKQKGPVVRLAEFLPEPSACAVASSDLHCLDRQQSSEAFWMPPLPTMTNSEVGASGFSTGIEGTSSMWHMQTPEQMQQQMQQQAHLQPQMLEPQMQQQAQPQLQQQLHDLQQMQAQLQQMQLQQMQMQQMQTQMQPTQMQPPQMQPPQMQPTHTQPLQAQAPQMQPLQMQTQMQPPPMQQASQMPPQIQPDQIFLHQLMQLQMQPQMQPPSWPPVQPPLSMAGELVPAPPPQMAMEAAAPSVLCPSTCHHAQVCRCGEAPPMVMSSAPAPDEQQQMTNMPNTCILLSAAMFPEMGTGTTESAGPQ